MDILALKRQGAPANAEYTFSDQPRVLFGKSIRLGRAKRGLRWYVVSVLFSYNPFIFGKRFSLNSRPF